MKRVYTMQEENKQQVLKMINSLVKELGSDDQIVVRIIKKEDNDALVEQLEREGLIF